MRSLAGIVFGLLVGSIPQLEAANVSDLQSDWSITNNPNGAWRYMQGSTLLGSQNFTGCFGGQGWAPGPAWTECLPAVIQVGADAANPQDYLNNDIVMVSPDVHNGNPANGPAVVAWTAPTDAIFTFTFGIWYAQSSVRRSNDFKLMYSGVAGTSTLASGTVAWNSGFNRTNKDVFVGNVAVSAGDVICLIVQMSPGQTNGSEDGVDLTFNAPEPGTFSSLLFAGIAATIFAAPRPRKAIASRLI